MTSRYIDFRRTTRTTQVLSRVKELEEKLTNTIGERDDLQLQYTLAPNILYPHPENLYTLTPIILGLSPVPSPPKVISKRDDLQL